MKQKGQKNLHPKKKQLEIVIERLIKVVYFPLEHLKLRVWSGPKIMTKKIGYNIFCVVNPIFELQTTSEKQPQNTNNIKQLSC